MTMVNYPEINPIAVDLGIIKVHWYGLMYFFAFILFIQLGKYKIKNHPNPSNLNEKILDDLFFYGALGVVLGGRLGYVLFYQPVYFFQTHLRFLQCGRVACPFTAVYWALLVH